MTVTSKYKIAIKDGRTLSKVHPDLAKELANPEEGDLIHAGSTKKVDWKCSKDHIWTVSPNNRIAGKTGCPFCANKKVWVGFNDLWTTEPELCKELADPNDGYKYTRRSGVQLNWKCSLGHVWDSRMSTRISGSGCSVCANRTVVVGFNDLKTTDPDLFKELTDKSLLITRGHGKKVEWRCAEGHTWSSTPNNRTNLNTKRGCPFCDKTQTSRSEIILRGLLRDAGYTVNADHTYRIDVAGWTRKSAQVDILFEHQGLQIVVEYDGAYWHKDRRDMDLLKTNMLLDNGYHVIRISAQSNHRIDPLPITDPRFLSLDTIHSSDNTKELRSVVLEIENWILNLTHDIERTKLNP